MAVGTHAEDTPHDVCLAFVHAILGMGFSLALLPGCGDDLAAVGIDPHIVIAVDAPAGVVPLECFPFQCVASALACFLPFDLRCVRLERKQTKGDEALVPTSTFFAGYLTVWTSFSVGATALQWVLEQLALLSPMMVSTSPLLGGLVLILAAIYQWTPYKDACLKYCRSPVWFLSTHWRDGTWGAYLMGLEHGMYCLGCCWVLMAILFVGGVMNLLCVAAITIFVLVEKVAPFGRAISRAATVILLLSGGAMIIGV